MENLPEENGITPIGKVDYRNKEKKFGIKTDDRRRHVYVIGKTGVGKSTLLENMAIADIKAGRGVGMIDPHGDLADTLLDHIPEERIDDVVYFDPSDMNYPIAFNPLEQVSDEHRHLIASSMMGVFKKIWPDVWSSRMEYILNNTLLALLEYPGTTIIGILRMFSDKDYRKQIVEGLEDQVVKDFWQKEFAKYSQQYQTTAVAAIQNKVGQFVTNPLIRNILGRSHSSISMKKIMDEGKILIVNLSKGKIGEDNMSLLGGMIITKLQLAAMSRAKYKDKNFKDFYLSVDEFQNFATDSFASILSEARKYKLSLTLAHQYINQLIFDGNTKVRDAIVGNVGSMICFRVGAHDAEFLEKEFLPEYSENDLVNLPKYQILTRLMINGLASTPFPAKTLAPIPKPEESYRDEIIELSREKYGAPRSYVERKMQEEWDSDQTIKRKKKGRKEVSLDEALTDKNSSSKENGSKDKSGKENNKESKSKNKEVKKDVDVEELKGFIQSALDSAEKDDEDSENN